MQIHPPAPNCHRKIWLACVKRYNNQRHQQIFEFPLTKAFQLGAGENDIKCQCLPFVYSQLKARHYTVQRCLWQSNSVSIAVSDIAILSGCRLTSGGDSKYWTQLRLLQLKFHNWKLYSCRWRAAAKRFSGRAELSFDLEEPVRRWMRGNKWRSVKWIRFGKVILGMNDSDITINQFSVSIRISQIHEDALEHLLWHHRPTIPG